MSIRRIPVWGVVMVLACGTGLAACKSSGSAVKDTGAAEPVAAGNDISEADFIRLCNERLNDPADFGMTKGVLLQFFKTADCAAVYPILKKVTATSAAASQPAGG